MHIKSLAIVAAAVMTAGAAQAADLNKPAKVAVDYVKVCDAYGAGFFYIPGSDTCLKISGLVRAQFETGGTTKGSDIGVYQSGLLNGASTRGSSTFWTGARADVNFDARTNTQYGLLRSFIDFHPDFGSSGANSARTTVELDSAFVQFGGLTAGRAETNYAFLFNSNIDNEFEAFTDTSSNQLAYTFTFGNGVTGTIAIEDPTTVGYQNTASGVGSAPARNFSAAGSFTYGALNAPDIIGNLKVSQAWGSAQLSAGAHQDYGSAATPYTKWGYGIQGGVKFNVPTLGAGDTLGVQAAYSVGATNLAYTYLYTGGTAGISSADLGRDAAVANGVLKQAKLWTIGAAFAHHFSPTLEFDFTPSYYAITNSNTAGALNYNAIELGAQLDWTPVKGIDIIPDVEYRNVQTSSSTRAAGNATFSNASAYVFDLRIQRSF